MAQARANGVDDVAPLTRREILDREPEISPRVRAGFLVSREAIIDPWSAPTAYLLQALAKGAECRRGCAQLGGRYDGAGWTLETSPGAVRTRAVANCARLHGASVDARLMGARSFPKRKP